MTDVDPIVGPSFTDKLHFIVPDPADGPPYTTRITYQQVDKGTPDAVTLPWVEDPDQWWKPLGEISDYEHAHEVTEDEWDAAVNAAGDKRQQLIDRTRSALTKAGLTEDQANLLLEGK